MGRRLGGFAVAIVLCLAVATTAYAADSVRIDGATVPGGENAELRVDLTFACDANAGGWVLDVMVTDETRPAHASNTVNGNNELCTGKAQPAEAYVKTQDQTRFRAGDRLRVSVSIRRGQQQSAHDDKEVTAT